MRQVFRAGALGRPRGMGWGGRWGERSGWGTHVNLWLIHVNVWQKPLQYCKVISLQLIKMHGKKSHIGTTEDQHTHERNNILNTTLKTAIKSQENRTKEKCIGCIFYTSKK